MSNIDTSSSKYRTLHQWVERNLGKANKCENDPSHKTTRYHWANISGEYERDLSDWAELCPSCHKLFDGPTIKTECKNGHSYSEHGRRSAGYGWNYCRKCKNNLQNKRRGHKFEDN